MLQKCNFFLGLHRHIYGIKRCLCVCVSLKNQLTDPLEEEAFTVVAFLLECRGHKASSPFSVTRARPEEQSLAKRPEQCPKASA